MSFIDSDPNLSHKINNLRALAALFVVFFHYFIFFFTDHKFCAKLSCFPPLDMSPFEGFIQFLEAIPFNLGYFAVAFFFLISGFLTPYLFERYTSRRLFFKNRFFRLWPTYVIGLSINILFIWGACLYNGIDFPFSFSEISASFFGLRDVLGYPFITGIVWTFEIEIKFILFCFIVYPLIQKPSLRLLVALCIILFWICFWGQRITQEDLTYPDALFYFFRSLTHNIKFFCFLLEGVIYYFFLSNKISKKEFLILSIILMLSFIAELYFTLKIDYFIQYLLSYFSGLGVFIWYMGRVFTKSQSLHFFHFVAKTSYPLYLIHAVPSYIIMFILYDLGISLFWGIGLAFLVCFALSYITHCFVEEPVRGLWKKIHGKIT